jgi:hypothetical protein
MTDQAPYSITSMSMEDQTMDSNTSRLGEPRGQPVSEMDTRMSDQVSLLTRLISISLTLILSSPELRYTKVTLGANALHPKLEGQSTIPPRTPNPQLQVRHYQALTPKKCSSLRPMPPDSITGRQNARPTARTPRMLIEQTGQQVLSPSPVYQLFTSDPPKPERAPRSETGRKWEVMNHMRGRQSGE